MGKYLKNFETSADYQAYIGGEPFLPNVSFVKEGNGVKMQPTGAPNANGHPYVKLWEYDVPDGKLEIFWATCNVGATHPEEQGALYAWGETASQIIGSSGFTSASYKFGSQPSKYNGNDNLSVLLPEDDAAHVNMGGEWMMPDISMARQLFNLTNTANTVLNGVSGITFTSREDAAQSIFIPFSTNIRSLTVSRAYNVLFSTATLANGYQYARCNFVLNTGAINVMERYVGMPVRGVIVKRIYY